MVDMCRCAGRVMGVGVDPLTKGCDMAASWYAVLATVRRSPVFQF